MSFRRLSFALIAIFWMVMNALLWRSEFGSGHDLASALPVETVWEKILTAPDDSRLSVIVEGRKVGYLHWRPTVGEELAGGKIGSENEPEGIVRKRPEYKVELEGSYLWETMHKPVRFTATVDFNQDQEFKAFEGEAVLRPVTWKIRTDPVEKKVWFQSSEGDTDWIKQFTFEQLRNPAVLLSQFDSPLIGLMLGQAAQASTNDVSLGLKWSARQDWLRFGQSQIRVYRLETMIMNRWPVVILVTRVGEFIRIELPGETRLVNDGLLAG